MKGEYNSHRKMFEKLKELAEVLIEGRIDWHDGEMHERWSAHLQRCEIKQDGILATACAFGTTPEEALWRLWHDVTELPKGHYIVRDALRKERQAFLLTGGASGGEWVVIDERAMARLETR